MSAWSCSVLEVMRGNPVQRITSTSLTFTEEPKAQNHCRSLAGYSEA